MTQMATKDRCPHECGTETSHLICICVKCGEAYTNREHVGHEGRSSSIPTGTNNPVSQGSASLQGKRFQYGKWICEIDDEAGAGYLYIDGVIKDGGVAKTVSVDPHVNLDYDADGKLLGIEVIL